jgi:hypothetical protein
MAGCVVIPIPAKGRAVSYGDLPPSTGRLLVAVVYSPDFAQEISQRLGEKMAGCIVRGLNAVAPEISLLSTEAFHLKVVGVKPGEVLLRPETIGPLLSRPDIRQRVRDSGATHLVLVRHGESREQRATGAGPHLATRTTRLTASIFELAAAAEASSLESRAEGSVGVAAIPYFAIFVWLHMTETPACNALGAEVARALRGRPNDEKR